MNNKHSSDKKNVRSAIYICQTKSSGESKRQAALLQNFIVEQGFSLHDIFIDRKTDSAWQKLLASAQARQINCVVTWHYKQLGNTLAALAIALEQLESLDVALISYSQKIDTSKPSGQFFYKTVAELCQLESDAKSESVRLGLAKAKQRGTRLGRPQKDPAAQNRILALREKGLTMRQIASKEKLSPAGVFKILQRANLSGTAGGR